MKLNKAVLKVSQSLYHSDESESLWFDDGRTSFSFHFLLLSVSVSASFTCLFVSLISAESEV